MRLVSSSEAAKILGLSLQGIHYRIKKGQLKSQKKDGKIYVYIDETDEKITSKTLTSFEHTTKEYENKLLDAKDEQIELLKKTIKHLKKQYTSEISRLERNQEKILNVFQSEVDLLKSAFSEMKSIYQIEHKKDEVKSTSSESIDLKFMDIKDFFIYMKQYGKTDTQIKQIILDKIKSEDRRFIYKKETKEVIIYKDSFLDLI